MSERLFEAIDGAYRVSEAPDWDDVLRRVAVFEQDVRPPSQRAWWRSRRFALAAGFALGFAVCAGIAIGAVKLLGEPAPPAVQARLAPFLMRAGLERDSARVVAVAPDVTLYGVRNADGASCVELVGASRGLVFALQCRKPVVGGRLELGWGETGIASIVADDGSAPPVAVFGHLPADAVSARARLADGRTASVQIGLDGFYVYEPAPDDQATARRAAFTVEGLDAAGTVVASRRFEPPQPVRTLGSPPRQISGTVEIDGAEWLRIQVEGSSGDTSGPQVEFVRLPSSRTFSWTAPRNLPASYRVQVDVLDARGTVLASARPLDESEWRGLLGESRNAS